nr:hypothetical protein [Micavibrio sp.]
MIKALIFAVKVALIVGLALWVAERPGHVQLEWLDYKVTIHMGFFLLIILGLMLLSMTLFSIIRGIVGFPNSLKRYSQMQAREKTLSALTKGLSAVAAGDAKAAQIQANKAMKHKREEDSLPILLNAQAARLNGDEDKANKNYLKLIESKDASFLGVRGLLQSALDVNDKDTAQRLTQKALALHPKQRWIVKTAYDLAVQQRDWEEALGLLKKLERQHAESIKDYAHERAALYTGLAQDYLGKGWDEAAKEEFSKGLRTDRRFAPAVIELAYYYKGRGEAKSARKVIEKAAKHSMHDAYVSVWADLVEQGAGADKMVRYKHIVSLAKIAPKNARALGCAGAAAIDASLWGDAREYLERAIALKPTAETYR